MTIKLTDTQFAVLSEAAQRDDRCLTMPKGLKGGPAQKISAKLLAEGIVKEIRAKPGAPIWRRDAEVDKSYALKLTAAGLKVIADRTSAADESNDHAAPSSPPSSAGSAASFDLEAAGHAGSAPVATSSAAAAETGSPPLPDRSSTDSTTAPGGVTTTAPREGTKMAGVIALLEREHGATLTELIAATDWLPHTVRAALTGLRKRGFAVTLDRSNKERGSTYAIPRDQSVADKTAEAQTIEAPPAPVDATKKPGRRRKSEPAAQAATSSAS